MTNMQHPQQQQQKPPTLFPPLDYDDNVEGGQPKYNIMPDEEQIYKNLAQIKKRKISQAEQERLAHETALSIHQQVNRWQNSIRELEQLLEADEQNVGVNNNNNNDPVPPIVAVVAEDDNYDVDDHDDGGDDDDSNNVNNDDDEDDDGSHISDDDDDANEEDHPPTTASTTDSSSKTATSD